MCPEPQLDQQDLAALLSGEDLALNRIMDRYQGRLQGFAYRFTQDWSESEDLVVETFVRLYQRAREIRSGRALRAWLYRTLLRLCLNYRRWSDRHPTVSLSHEDAAAEDRTAGKAESPDPARHTELLETRAFVQNAVAELPEEMRSVLLLHHYDGMSYAEIGEIVGCSVRGVETRLYRARRRLRDSLGKLAMAAQSA